MKIFKQVFNFYIESSIHVAFSCYALVRMTQLLFQISFYEPLAFFAFFGTILAYNFVKFEASARTQRKQMRNQLKTILILSFLSLLAVILYFFQLQRITQYFSSLFLVITLLYALPFFPNKKNARNWSGIKIYIVTLCWVGVTLLLPILNAKILITFDFYFEGIQRFIIIFVLILIFEIIDLKNDDLHLQTVPQQIGVRRTKILGIILLNLFCFLELFKIDFNKNLLILNLIVAVIISLFLLFANEKRSKYYTTFWVESVPILWWLALILVQ